MKKLQYSFALFIILFSSCYQLSKNKYQFNRSFEFRSKMMYYDFLVKKKIFPPDHILYIDSASLFKFYEHKIKNDSYVIYQGTYINDSVSIKKSNFLADNKSCSGRIQQEIETNLKRKNLTNSELDFGSNISAYKMFYLKNNLPYDEKVNQHKKAIYLIYYFPLGTYYDAFYKEVFAITSQYESSANLYIICIDPVWGLK